jgi:two-component system response regulator AtoC
VTPAPSAPLAGPAAAATGAAEEPPPDGGLSLREHLEAVERGLIARTLAATGGNQSEAARRLGLSRSALIDRLKK